MGNRFDKLMRAHATASSAEYLKKSIELGARRLKGEDVSEEFENETKEAKKAFEKDGEHHNLNRAMYVNPLMAQGESRKEAERIADANTEREWRNILSRGKRHVTEGPIIKGTKIRDVTDNLHTISAILATTPRKVKLMVPKFTKGELGKANATKLISAAKTAGLDVGGEMTVTNIAITAAKAFKEVLKLLTSDRINIKTGKPVKQRGVDLTKVSPETIKHIKNYHALSAIKSLVLQPEKGAERAREGAKKRPKGQHNKKSK